MFNSVGDKKSLWANKVESHQKKQALNPFSDKFDKSLSRNLLNKDDPNYARPDSNSLSFMRAKAGEAKMLGEICDVCDVIFQHGQRSPDGTAAIMFGPLFSVNNLQFYFLNVKLETDKLTFSPIITSSGRTTFLTF